MSEGDSNPHFHLGRNAELTGDVALAVTHYSKSLELQPASSKAWESLAECLGRGESAVVSERRYWYETALLKALDFDRSNSDLWMKVARFLDFDDPVFVGEMEVNKLTCLLEAIDCAPKKHAAWMELSNVVTRPSYSRALPETIHGVAPRRLDLVRKAVELTLEEGDTPDLYWDCLSRALNAARVPGVRLRGTWCRPIDCVIEQMKRNPWEASYILPRSWDYKLSLKLQLGEIVVLPDVPELMLVPGVCRNEGTLLKRIPAGPSCVGYVLDDGDDHLPSTKEGRPPSPPLLDVHPLSMLVP